MPLRFFPSFNITALGAGMFFFLCLSRSKKRPPTPRLCFYRIHLSTRLTFPPLMVSRPSFLWVGGHAWPPTSICLFFPVTRCSPSSREWTTSWPLTSPPLSHCLGPISTHSGLLMPTPPIPRTTESTPFNLKFFSPTLGFLF